MKNFLKLLLFITVAGLAYISYRSIMGPIEFSEERAMREKEIVACVAKGMTSKEIADKLCLSVHTVTTHRRNITSKLQIHTPAGLTIYAIVNKFVSIDEIKLQ